MKSEFIWGPFARGLFIALLWFIPLLVWVAPQYVFQYIVLLAFLGIGLRPLLQWSGLHSLIEHLAATREEKNIEKRYREHRRNLMLKERDKRYKRARTRDNNLPKNW